MGVVLRHLFHTSYGPLPVPVGASSSVRICVDLFNQLSVFGATGVEVFFVLSGFVIAHSLRDLDPTPGEIGRFILRRQLRLDPPYWAAIVLMLVLCAVSNSFPAWQLNRLPSRGELLLNFCYIQYLVPDVMPVLNISWTLCLEIQFYLAFIFVLWLADGSPRRAAPTMVLTGAGSLLVHAMMARPGLGWNLTNDPGPLLFPYWYHFAAGALAYWAMAGMARSRVFGLYVLIFTGFAVVAPWHGLGGYDGAHTRVAPAMLVGLFTAMLLWHAGRRGQLGRWLATPLLRYFGNISYSLYLTHEMTIWVVVHWLNSPPTSPLAWALVTKTVAGLASMGVATLFYLAVEKPSVQWAAKFRGHPGLPVAKPTLPAENAGT